MQLEVESLGTSSVTFAWRITHDGEIAVTGRHTVVQVDGDGQALPLADGTRAALVPGAPLAGVA